MARPSPTKRSALSAPQDHLGRALADMRLSVTDRCNFRCRYCLPREMFENGFRFLPHKDILRYEEMARLARLMSSLGVRRVRLTGGEPLVRRDLPVLVSLINEISGIEDIALTTNGSLLTDRLAEELAQAGLKRITISLDALDPEIASRMAGVDVDPNRILDAIESSAAAGLHPVKVNMVVRRGYNESEILPMAQYFRDRGHILRFIEFMDVGTSNDWRREELVSAREILDLIGTHWPLEPLEPTRAAETARRYRYRGHSGEIGLIASVTQPFCSACSRARLSAEGRLYTCLFAATGIDLRTPMRAGADDAQLTELIASTWRQRSDRYSELRGQLPANRPKVEMSHIGG